MSLSKGSQRIYAKIAVLDSAAILICQQGGGGGDPEEYYPLEYYDEAIKYQNELARQLEARADKLRKRYGLNSKAHQGEEETNE